MARAKASIPASLGAVQGRATDKLLLMSAYASFGDHKFFLFNKTKHRQLNTAV